LHGPVRGKRGGEWSAIKRGKNEKEIFQHRPGKKELRGE